MTYYHELDNTYFTVGSNTFIGAVYEAAGLRNIADAPGGRHGLPQLSGRVRRVAEPDLIFLADAGFGESAETVAARPRWGGLTAVTNGAIIPLDADIASRWGPRVVDFLQVVTGAVTDLDAWPRPAAELKGAVPATRHRLDRRCRRRVGGRRAARGHDRAGRPAWWRVPLDLVDSLPLVRIHSGLTSQQHDLIWQIRMPWVVLAAIVGGALSISGASYQGCSATAGRSVPARGGRRRRPRGDARVRVRPAAPRLGGRSRRAGRLRRRR